MGLEDYIKMAISIGQSETTSIIKDGIKLKSVYESLFCHLGLQGTDSFNEVCENLNDAELIAFFIGEVLIEDYLFPSGNGVGSTTPTKFIYYILLQRHLDEIDYFLGDWAFQFSINPHVPYDGIRGTTLLKSQSSQEQDILLQDDRYRHPLFYYAIKDIPMNKESLEYLISNWEYVLKKHPDNNEDRLTHFIRLMKWQKRNDQDFPLPNGIEDIVAKKVKLFYKKNK